MILAKQLTFEKTHLFVDLDGVVLLGEALFPGADHAIAQLRERKKIIRFLTNNSGSRPESVANKLTRLGIPTAKDEVVTSGSAAAIWAAAENLQNIFVSGTAELVSLFEEKGIKTTMDSAESSAIFVGANKEFNYKSISQALPGLLAGKPFIACNRDAYFPVGAHSYLPGCGSMVGALEGACNRSVNFVVGKPNVFMLELLCKNFQVSPSQCLMIGDSLESDIAMANRFGMDSILVGSGLQTTAEAIPSASASSLLNLV